MRVAGSITVAHVAHAAQGSAAPSLPLRALILLGVLVLLR